MSTARGRSWGQLALPGLVATSLEVTTQPCRHRRGGADVRHIALHERTAGWPTFHALPCATSSGGQVGPGRASVFSMPHDKMQSQDLNPQLSMLELSSQHTTHYTCKACPTDGIVGNHLPKRSINITTHHLSDTLNVIRFLKFLFL